jgi:hypothetical protein
MNERQEIYDEISRVLTEYEEQDSERPGEAADLYALVVKIQSRWQDVITAQ